MIFSLGRCHLLKPLKIHIFFPDWHKLQHFHTKLGYLWKLWNSTNFCPRYSLSPKLKLWKYSTDPIKACSRVRKYSWIQYWGNERFIKTCESIWKPLHWIIWELVCKDYIVSNFLKVVLVIKQSLTNASCNCGEWVSSRKQPWIQVWLQQRLHPSKRFPLQFAKV